MRSTVGGLIRSPPLGASGTGRPRAPKRWPFRWEGELRVRHSKLDVGAIEFPALAINRRQGLIDVRHSPQELTTCGAGALRNGYFDGLLVVEANCRVHQVSAARKLR